MCRILWLTTCGLVLVGFSNCLLHHAVAENEHVGQERLIKGQLRLPAGEGSRGIHVIVDIRGGRKTIRKWLELDDEFKFQSTYSGELESLEIATGPALIAHRLTAQDLAKFQKREFVDVGVIDLTKQLRGYKIKLTSENAPTIRLGMWRGKPGTDGLGNLPSLGSRQFREIKSGATVDWLLPSTFDSAYFLMEEPADNKRGRQWRTGKQKLFGPIQLSKMPRHFKI